MRAGPLENSRPELLCFRQRLRSGRGRGCQGVLERFNVGEHGPGRSSGDLAVCLERAKRLALEITDAGIELETSPDVRADSTVDLARHCWGRRKRPCWDLSVRPRQGNV